MRLEKGECSLLPAPLGSQGQCVCEATSLLQRGVLEFVLTPCSAEGVPFPSGIGSWWDSLKSRCVAGEIQLKLNIRLTCQGCAAVGLLCLPGCSVLLSHVLLVPGSTSQCRSLTRMGCYPSSPRCHCTTCISFSPSPSTGTSTSAPTWSLSETSEASQVTFNTSLCFLNMEAWKEMWRGQLGSGLT